MFKTTILAGAMATASVMMIGCPSRDRQLAEFAERAADRQAQQNQAMAELNRQVAEGSKRLIEADAEARRETIELQQQLQAQQADIGQQRDRLESDRRQIAADRNRQSIVGPAITGAALLLAAVLPLVIALILVWRSFGDSNSAVAVGELLIEELVTDGPRLLPPPAPEPAGAEGLAWPQAGGGHIEGPEASAEAENANSPGGTAA